MIFYDITPPDVTTSVVGGKYQGNPHDTTCQSKPSPHLAKPSAKPDRCGHLSPSIDALVG
jgi:hypothetical protein